MPPLTSARDMVRRWGRQSAFDASSEQWERVILESGIDPVNSVLTATEAAMDADLDAALRHVEERENQRRQNAERLAEPTTVRLIHNRATTEQREHWVVEVRRGNDRVDSYTLMNEEAALQQFNRTIAEQRADNARRVQYAKVGQVWDLRADTVRRPSAFRRGRVDRRSVRPEDDTIKEDDLSLNITEEPPAPTPVEEFEEVNELIEELAEMDWIDDDGEDFDEVPF